MVVGSRRHPLSIGAEFDRVNRALVFHRFREHSARAHVPEPNGRVVGGGRQGPPVRTERGLIHLLKLAEGLGEKLAGVRIPQTGRAIETRGDDDAACGIELNVVQSIRVTQGRHYRSAGIDVPNHRCSVAG